jgi:hypothetical protein
MTLSIIPINGTQGCAGYLLRCARGFRAFDQHNKEIGTYAAPDLAVAAVLELAATGIPDSSD